MAAIDNIISVNVTSATTAVATQTFATPLILGPTLGGATPTVITCTQPSDLLTQGYTTASVEYTYAQALCSQALAPSTFKVATRSASGTISADLAAVQAIDDSWYALITPTASDSDILASAQAIESQTKLYVAASSTAAIGQTGTTDIGSLLQAKSFTRTALMFSPGSAALGIEAAWVGGQVPKSPGSATWAYKTLSGIATDTLSPSQQNIAFGVPISGTHGKAVNIYQSVGGVAITQEGTTSDGGFIDNRIGIDSLRSTMRSNCYSSLVNNGKIPFTDNGAVIFESAVRAAIDTHVGFGFIDGRSPIIVTHTPVANVPATQKAQRIGPPIQFSCRTAGAQHAVLITGTVSL